MIRILISFLFAKDSLVTLKPTERFWDLLQEEWQQIYWCKFRLPECNINHKKAYLQAIAASVESEDLFDPKAYASSKLN